MDNRKIRFTPKNITFYIVGFILLGLGVNLLARSDFGIGAWDTTTFNLHLLINSDYVTKGITSMIISFTLMTFVIAYTRKWVLLFISIPILLLGSFIDFWDIYVFGTEYMPTEIFLRIGFFISGAIMLPFGLALVVASKFPATIFDELTIVVMDILKTRSITKARLVVEFIGISLGVLFGLLATGGLAYVSWGSLVLAVILPPVINFFINLLGRPDDEEHL